MIEKSCRTCKYRELYFYTIEDDINNLKIDARREGRSLKSYITYNLKKLSGSYNEDR